MSDLIQNLKFVKIENKIVGSLLEKSDKLVILTHGLFGNRLQFPLPELSIELYKAGFSTFRFDFRGKGESFSDQTKFSIRSMIEDLKTVLKYFKNKYDKIYIVAKSISSIPVLISKPKVEKVIFLGIPFKVSESVSEEEIKIAEEGYFYYDGFKYGYELLKEMKSFDKKKIIKLVEDFDIQSAAIFGEKDHNYEIAKEMLPTRYMNIYIIPDVGHSFGEKEEGFLALRHVIIEELCED